MLSSFTDPNLFKTDMVLFITDTKKKRKKCSTSREAPKMTKKKIINNAHANKNEAVKERHSPINGLYFGVPLFHIDFLSFLGMGVGHHSLSLYDEKQCKHPTKLHLLCSTVKKESQRFR